MGNGTMRIFIAVGLVTVGIFAAAGSLAPIAAQEGATAANPYNLPPTHFGSENPQAVHAFDVAPGFADAPVADNPQAPDAKTVGQQVCTACHSKESQVFAHTTHALGMQVAFTANPEAATCEACHGPGSTHAQDPLQPGAIIAFTKDGGTPLKTQTESCLGCHTGGPRDHWLGSIHQRNQLSCSDCHNPLAVCARGSYACTARASRGDRQRTRLNSSP